MKALDWITDYRHPWRFFGAIGLIIVSVVVLVVHDELEWEKFAEAHDCKVIAKSEGHYANTFVNGQVGTAYIAGDTTYHCDDGVNYTR